MTVHCASFYKLGGIWVLALPINSNFHDFHRKMGTILNKNNGPEWAHHGPNEWAQERPGPKWGQQGQMNGPAQKGPNEWAQRGPNERVQQGPNDSSEFSMEFYRESYNIFC